MSIWHIFFSKMKLFDDWWFVGWCKETLIMFIYLLYVGFCTAS